MQTYNWIFFNYIDHVLDTVILYSLWTIQGHSTTDFPCIEYTTASGRVINLHKLYGSLVKSRPIYLKIACPGCHT